ncbi:flagellar motor switch protein FliN [Nocardioides daejeonensis]|uniref:flagellar motor switch protein FliN n=1 Tax=Nocardioides daejeonensis TaxID=1046556 RepID=UPI000D74C56D|nr:flagellar motor switch protein FliN [Nocardioides daejeonensis]
MTELTGTDLAQAAAEAAAVVLPAAMPLTAAGAQPGTSEVASLFAGAVVADLPGAGRIALLVGEDLVAALASSPLGGLDLAAATQPAVDAVAHVLGLTADAARQVETALVVGDLGGAFTTVPLVGAGIDAAVLVPDALLAPRPAPTPTFAPVAAEVPATATPAAPLPTFGAATAPAATLSAPVRGIEMLHGVDMEVTVELGRTRMTVRDLLALSPGAVLELDRAAGSPADLLVNGRLIARGEVVVIDEDFGLRITEVLDDSQAG